MTEEAAEQQQDDIAFGGDAAAEPVEGGPNAPHVNEDETTGDAEWQGDDAPPAKDASPDSSSETEPEQTQPATEPTETQPEQQTPGEAGESESPTEPAAGAEEPAEAAPAPPPAAKPAAKKPAAKKDGPKKGAGASGEISRPYTVLEKRRVVTLVDLYEILGEEEYGKVIDKVGEGVAAFIERDEKVVARNAEAAIRGAYDKAAPDEAVEAVLPLSAIAFRVIRVQAERVVTTRLKMDAAD